MCISDTKDNSCTAVNCVSVPRIPQKSEIYYRQYTAMHKYKMFNGSQWKSIYFIPFVSISSVVCPIRIISEVKNTTVEDLNSHILRSHTDDVRQTGLQYKLHSGQGSSQNPVTAHQHQVYVTVYSKMMAFSVLNVKLHYVKMTA